jgi:RNase P subunit RPR2
VPVTQNLKLSGVMAEHARNKAHPGIILPKVKDHMLMTFGPDMDRDPTVIHPSEIAKDDWCPLATYRRIISGVWPEDEEFDFFRENIYETGNDIHLKWQTRMREAGFAVWGDWRCIICNWRVTGLEPPGETSEGHDHIWRYDEVTLDARAQLLMTGHADCGFDNTLVEIKSIGLGTLRIDAKDLLARYQEGRMTDLTGLWRAITKPLRSHLIQGDIYLHLAHILGLPFTQIVYLYEFKPNQMTKEFTIKYSPDRAKKLVAKIEAVQYAVEHGIPPKCIKVVGCKQCNAFPQPSRRTVARTRNDFT